MNSRSSQIPENGTSKLPHRQRLVLEYKQKLKLLVANCPHLSYSFNDKDLADDMGEVFQKIGFTTHPHPKQETGLLVRYLAQGLNAGHLVLLHYRPVSSDSNLLTLLRAVSKHVPPGLFQNLIPVFMMTYTSQKQQDIFRHLGLFGIRYATFLTPNAPIASNMEDLLKDLENFVRMVSKEILPTLDRQKVEGKEEKIIEAYRSLLSQGGALLHQGAYDEAITVYSEAIALAPRFEALMERGDAYYKSKKYIPALHDYREAYLLKRSEPEPYAKISICCFRLIKESAGREGPEKAKKWLALGVKHFKDAKNLIDKMVSENRDSPEVLPKAPYALLVNALTEGDLRGMDFNEGEKQISQLTEDILKKTASMDFLDAEIDIDARIDQAILLTRNGQYEKAEKIFRNIIKEDPSLVGPAFNNFAVELRKNGAVHQAFEIYRELLGFEIPDKDIVLENLKAAGLNFAQQLRMDFRQEEAIEVYKNILRHNPRGKEWVLCDLALTFLEMQNQAQASFRLMEAIYINPKLMGTDKFKQYSDLANLRKEMMMKLTECEP